MRLKEIDAAGGVERETARIAALARYFRNKLSGLPFVMCSKRMSNAMTPVQPASISAYDLFLRLKDEYGIWICPNGGELKDRMFRVGHIGELTNGDYDKLIFALGQLVKSRGL